METRYSASPVEAKRYSTQELRKEFMIKDLFQADEVKMVYSHIDRMITGSAMPVKQKLCISSGEELHVEYFLQRREMGIINIGGKGKITADNKEYLLD